MTTITQATTSLHVKGVYIYDEEEDDTHFLQYSYKLVEMDEKSFDPIVTEFQMLMTSGK